MAHPIQLMVHTDPRDVDGNGFSIRHIALDQVPQQWRSQLPGMHGPPNRHACTVEDQVRYMTTIKDATERGDAKRVLRLIRDTWTHIVSDQPRVIALTAVYTMRPAWLPISHALRVLRQPATRRHFARDMWSRHLSPLNGMDRGEQLAIMCLMEGAFALDVLCTMVIENPMTKWPCEADVKHILCMIASPTIDGDRALWNEMMRALVAESTREVDADEDTPIDHLLVRLVNRPQLDTAQRLVWLRTVLLNWPRVHDPADAACACLTWDNTKNDIKNEDVTMALFAITSHNAYVGSRRMRTMVMERHRVGMPHLAGVVDGKWEEDHGNDLLCSLCCERRVCVCMTPCGHVATCGACYAELRERDDAKCVICRTPVTGAIVARFA
jgi:hypothetical protein